MTITKVKQPQDKEIQTYLVHNTTFNTATNLTAPVTLPTTPILADVIIEKFDNLGGNERVSKLWRYNGTTWVQIGHNEYSTKEFADTVSASLSITSLPANPVNFNSNLTTTYVPGDVLKEEYANGYINWHFNGTVWQIKGSREFVKSGKYNVYLNHLGTFDTASIPTQPVPTPTDSLAGDIIIQTYDNLRGNERVTIRWKFNGTVWLMNGHVEYHPLIFSNVIALALDIGTLPTVPSGYSTNLTTNYVPGDTLHQEYDNGYIHWTFNGTVWVRDYARTISTGGGGGGSGLTTYLRHATAFNTSSIPTGPTGVVGTPVSGDVAIQVYDNLAGTERATIRWYHNGTTWIQNGHVEYNTLKFTGLVVASLNVSALPSAPVNFNTNLTTTYIPGDTLKEEYTNGYIDWEFNGTAWVVKAAREFVESGKYNVHLNHSTSFDTASIPTQPSPLPSDALNGDIIIQSYDNLRGNERVTIRWRYNGSAWVMIGHVEYNTLAFFGTEVTFLSIITAPTVPGGTFNTNVSTNFVPGDTLHVEYADGYIKWQFNGTTWTKITTRIISDTNQKHFQRHATSFSLSAIPTAPTSATGANGDTAEQTYDNLKGTERVTIRWTHNGTTWVQDGHVEYNPLKFVSVVASNINFSSLPTTPSGYNASLPTSYVPGDTLVSEYLNGYIHWTFNGTAWVLDHARQVSSSNNKVTIGVVGSFTDVPVNPVAPPSTPITNDIYIETYNNTTGTQRVIIRWVYNGTAWVMNGTPEYNTQHFFATVASTFAPGLPPTAPVVPGTTADYIVGDTLWEQYQNGYVTYKRGATQWNYALSRNLEAGINNLASTGTVASFNSTSIPSSPSSPPAGAISGDIYIERFNNTTGNQRAIIRWKHNGSIWQMEGQPEYNIRFFGAVSITNINYESLPSAPSAPGTGLNYVPGDVMFEDRPNGYIIWVRGSSAWSLESVRRIDYDTNTITSVGTVGTFNAASIPTTPASAPTPTTSGQVHIEQYTNTTGTNRVIIRWLWNGTAWTSDTPEYNTRAFFATVASNLTVGALPSTPATPGASTAYVPGDTLHETFNNGYLKWRYGTSSWTLVASAVNTNNTSYVKATGSWAESGTEPASPSNAPSNPKINDLLINTYDNGTRNNAVTKHWTYSGSAWVAVTNGTHRRNQLITNVPGTALTYGVAPTAALAGTNTNYVNGDILWEKYTNGYGLYKFNNGAWVIQTYGLEVGRIQDSADFQATLGAGVDGYAVVYNHTLGKFTLADI